MAANRRVRAIARLIAASPRAPYSAEAQLVAENIGDDFVGISPANGQSELLKCSSQLRNAAGALGLKQQSQQAIAQVCAAQIVRPEIRSSRRVVHRESRNTALDNTALDNTALDNTALDNTALDNTALEEVLLTLVKFISAVCRDSAPMSPGSAALRRELGG